MSNSSVLFQILKPSYWFQKRFLVIILQMLILLHQELVLDEMLFAGIRGLI